MYRWFIKKHPFLIRIVGQIQRNLYSCRPKPTLKWKSEINWINWTSSVVFIKFSSLSHWVYNSCFRTWIDQQRYFRAVGNFISLYTLIASSGCWSRSLQWDGDLSMIRQLLLIAWHPCPERALSLSREDGVTRIPWSRGLRLTWALQYTIPM